jgi:hypothetical protein
VGSPQLPSDFGLLAWSFPLWTPQLGNYSLDLDYIVSTKIRIRQAGTIARVWYYLKTHAAALSGNNYIGIMNSSGTTIGRTGDMKTAWQTTDTVDDTSGSPSASGINSATVTAESGQSLAIAAGDWIDVQFLGKANGATAPVFASNPTYGATNATLTGIAANAWRTGNGKTDLQATYVNTDVTSTGAYRNATLWVGVSTS